MARKKDKTSDEVVTEIMEIADKATTALAELVGGSRRRIRKARKRIGKTTSKAETQARKVRGNAERQVDAIRQKTAEQVEALTDKLRRTAKDAKKK